MDQLLSGDNFLVEEDETAKKVVIDLRIPQGFANLRGREGEGGREGGRRGRERGRKGGRKGYMAFKKMSTSTDLQMYMYMYMYTK